MKGGGGGARERVCVFVCVCYYYWEKGFKLVAANLLNCKGRQNKQGKIKQTLFWIWMFWKLKKLGIDRDTLII